MFEFPSSLFDFCMSIASFAWKPLHVLFSHILHHKPLWTLDLDKCPRAILEENGNHKNLECSACMNLDDLHVQVHLGPLLDLHRPTPAPIHSLLDQVVAIMHHWKGRKKLGPATGRPTPWSADSLVASLYLTRCTGSPWHSPCLSSTSPTSCSSFLCSLCSCFSPSS